MARDSEVGPGQGGPCPICGKDMAERVYEEMYFNSTNGCISKEVSLCRGRYWHMKNEHAIMEDYNPP